MKIGNRQQALGNSKKQKFVVCTLCVMLFALCPPGDAQLPKKVPRIGYLTGATPDGQSARIAAFRQGLRELGYVEGKNIVVEYDMPRKNSIVSPRSRPTSCV